MSVSSSDAQARGRAQDRYRWRGRKTAGNRLTGGLYRHRVKVFWATLLILALLLFAWLIWLLLFAPQRTPLVVFSADPYSWPLPPNAFATEDLESLAALDGESVTLRGADEPVLSAQGFMDRLDREIQQGHQQDPDLPLVFWVSMHGIADFWSDKVHLVPPQSSPTDANTWIDLKDVVTRLSQVPPDRNVLLILDCQRIQVNWNLGLPVNHFAQRVREVFGDAGSGNLAVLLAAGADEQAVVSADLRSSVFGHYLPRALAGAADGQSQFGNGDGWVSLLEVSRYLQHHVNRWVASNRGCGQNPLLLIQDERRDFRLTRSLRRGSTALRIGGDSKTQRRAPAVAADRLDRLWRQLDDFRELGLYQREPLAWRDLEHQLLWLEQLSESGVGYQNMAIRTGDEAERTVQAIQRRLAQWKESRSISDACTVISGSSWQLPYAMRVHSLPLAEYFGTARLKSARATRDLVETFGERPEPTLLSETLSTLEKESASEWESGQFLRMLDRYQFAAMWRQPQTLQQLLNLRAGLGKVSVPQSDAGLPGDPRVHRWTRQLVARADLTRRQTEDRLFVQGQPGMVDNLKVTQASLGDAVVTGQTLERIMRTCDHAMAQTPYLAQWLTHPLHREDPAETNRQVNEQLLPLVAKTLELSKQLADDRNVTTESIAAVERFAVTNVGSPLESLVNDWSRWQKRLLFESESDHPETAGELMAALSIPLIRWDDRRDLRSALSRLSARLNADYDDGSTAANDDQQSAQPASLPSTSYSERLAGWSENPFLAFLDPQIVADELTENPISGFLKGIANQLAQQSNEVSLADQRVSCSEAARRMRAAAPIWFAAPERNPVVELLQIDLQDLLIWNAERVLEDFWGPAGQDRAFFDLAATDYLQAAGEFTEIRFPTQQPPGEVQELQSLQRRLLASRRSAASWITTTTQPQIQIDSGDPVESLITVQETTGEVAFFPPRGAATMMIQDTNARRVEKVTFTPADFVSLPAVDAEVSVVVPADLGRRGRRLRAQAMFRGHEYGAPLSIEPLDGITIDITPFRYRRSEVTLSSPWNKLSVVFVLDCSQSMEDALVPEAADSAAAPRLEVAKTTLQEILFDLALRRNVRAGIHFFGHRLGWSTDVPVRPLTRPDFFGEIPADVTPSQDVETVLPLGNFGLDDAKSVIPRINGVQPWGQSPLYLSVVQALDDFNSQDAESDRHVIVITDGANYQYIPPTETGVRATSDEDVRAAWLQNRIPVHILGLGLDRQSDQQAVEEFERLCLDTGGQFQSLTGSTDLTSAMNEILDPGTYRLDSPDDAQGPARSAVLGTSVRVSPAPTTPQQFWLTYQGGGSTDPAAAESPEAVTAQEEVWLEGGESLQLYVNKSADAIQAFPFDDNVVAWDNWVTTQGSATDHVMRAHRPDRDSQGHVTFPISWQFRDGRFSESEQVWRVTDRPAEIWVEVQPLTSANEPTGPSYVFYDANYEPEQPVPLVNLVARDWPKSASRARLRPWCKPTERYGFELLPPTTSVVAPETGPGMSKMIAINESPQPEMTVLPGVTLGVDFPDGPSEGPLRRFRFILEFQQAGPPVTSLKLDFLPHTGPKPARIVRRFDQRHRMSVHEFYFDREQSNLPKDIELSNRERAIESAWELEKESLIVDVAEPGMFLPVSTR